LTKIVIILTIFMVGIVAVMVLSNWYMTFWMKNLVQKKHEWIEFIMDTSVIPPDWVQPYLKKVERLRHSAGSEQRVARLEERAKTNIQRRLKRLLNYVKYATLIDEDHLRLQIQNKLTAVGEAFQVGDNIFAKYE
jgi:hypothetical protein